MKLTKFEKILIALVAAWIVQGAADPLLHRMMMKMLVAMETGKNGMPDVTTNYWVASAVVGCLVKSVYGYWLYLASRYEKEKKWIWCLVGFFGGIYGVLIFYPYLILKELRGRTAPNKPEDSSPSAGHRSTSVSC
jgi:hypothetical protein